MNTITEYEQGPISSTVLYIVIPPSPLFAAHWSFFVPNLSPYDPVSRRQEESSVGRRIHVSGDRLKGFDLEIIRGYDIKKHRGAATRRFTIGCISTDHLIAVEQISTEHQTRVDKDDEEGGGYVDNNPSDELERVCVEIEAPGPSLNSVKPGSHGVNPPEGIRKLPEVKDCQWWVRKVVQVLEERGILTSLPLIGNQDHSSAPSQIVKTLPVH